MAFNKGISDQGFKRLAKIAKTAQEFEDEEFEDGAMNPPTIYLDNMDHDDGMVLVFADEPGAGTWAKEEDQSIQGSNWEADSEDYAYAIIMDELNLVETLESQGYNVNSDSYDPPIQEDLDAAYQKYLDEGGR